MKGVRYMKEKSISSKEQEKISMLDYILLENCTNEEQRKQMLKIIKNRQKEKLCAKPAKSHIV